MRFFSKIVFICNLCFMAFVVLRKLETLQNAKGNHNAVIPLPILQNSLVVLGISAIIINFIFVTLMVVFKLAKKQHHIAKWLVWANFLFLMLQFIYFKLY